MTRELILGLILAILIPLLVCTFLYRMVKRHNERAEQLQKQMREEIRPYVEELERLKEEKRWNVEFCNETFVNYPILEECKDATEYNLKIKEPKLMLSQTNFERLRDFHPEEIITRIYALEFIIDMIISKYI